MPKLSIIVPTYNRSDLLIPTLESLVSQESLNYEIIVVDDGSTDETEQVVIAFIGANSSTNIRFYKVTNRERGAARNYGITKSKGDYVNFFDSDDIAYKNHVTLYENIVNSQSSAEVFALSYDIKDSEGVILKSKILREHVSDFISRGNDLSCNGVFIKREIAMENPFSENRSLSGSEDYELWLRLSAKYDFPCFPQVSHAVVQHEQRSTMNFDPEPLIKRKLLMLDLAFTQDSVMKRFGHAKNIMKSSAFSYIALHIAMTGKSKTESVKWFWKSLKAHPQSVFTRRSLAILKHLSR